MNSKTIRWGIIGLGRIAHQFADGLKLVKNAELQAVASSNSDRAREFASKYNVPEFYGSYEELAESANVDVVYIASYNTQHFAHTMLCLENGKHVLCEKPSTIHAKDTKAMFEFAATKKLFLMEALWTLFLPSIAYVNKTQQSGELGALKRIDATFGFPAAERNSRRLYDAELGGGALYDIGIYPILLSHHFFGKPKEINARVERGDTGVDVYSEYQFKYPNAEANMKCSFNGFLDNEATFYFEKGKVVLEAMWHAPTSVKLMIDNKVENVEVSWEGNGYNYEAQFVTDHLLGKPTHQKAVTADFSIGLIEMIEKILELEG